MIAKGFHTKLAGNALFFCFRLSGICFLFFACSLFGKKYLFMFIKIWLFLCMAWSIPVDTGRKLNVHKTFRRRPGHILNVLCTFNLLLVSTGIYICFKIFELLDAL